MLYYAARALSASVRQRQCQSYRIERNWCERYKGLLVIRSSLLPTAQSYRSHPTSKRKGLTFIYWSMEEETALSGTVSLIAPFGSKNGRRGPEE